MYGPLALLVVAVGLFGAGVLWHRLRRREPDATPGGLDLEQVQGFVYVGSGALVVLGASVVVLGLAGREGYAEAMGVLGLIAYLVYLAVALLLIRRTARRRTARRAWAWTQPPAGPDDDAPAAG